MMLSPKSELNVSLHYKNSEAHLRDELKKLDLLIARRVTVLRALPRTESGMPAAKGLYISDDEVDELLGEAEMPLDESQASAGIDEHIAQFQRTIDEKLAGSAEHEVVLPLPRLAELFALSPFELQTIVICLAPELRRKYDTLYAYVQDDITRKKPSVDLVLDLICPSGEERWRRMALLSEHGALARQGILHTVEDIRSPSGSSGLARFLSLDPRILHFLLGDNTPDERLNGSIRWAQSTADDAMFAVDPAARTRLANLLGHYASRNFPQPRALTIYLQGPFGVGKRTLASELCAQFRQPLLILDLELLRAREADAGTALRLAFREGILNNAALYIESMDGLIDEQGGNGWLMELAQCLNNSGRLTFLAGQKPWPAQGRLNAIPFCTVELSLPDVPRRQAIWTRALSQLDGEANLAWASELASRFRLPPGQIADAANMAEKLSVMRDGKPAITLADLYGASCRASRHQLANLASRIATHCDWDDIVLPRDKEDQLREICLQMVHRHRVFGQWGFRAKRSRGLGLSVLFCGASGTGKTLAAEVIAHELHLELYRIDLSGVVSKYIGETEKNLAKIFHEAESSNAILFFDEADALFGKRTQISDAHDRYANIETSYLLQRMEEYEGMAILATNLRDNMDEAFTRRLRFIVEFPFPDAACRQAIWRRHIPRQAPVGDDLDFAWLGWQFPIAGGTIKNIVLAAAFLAAADRGAITMAHVVRGARREFEKIGKIWNDQRFVLPQ